MNSVMTVITDVRESIDLRVTHDVFWPISFVERSYKYIVGNDLRKVIDFR